MIKQFSRLCLLLCVVFACKKHVQTSYDSAVVIDSLKYESFGMPILNNDALPASRMLAHFNTMNVGDTVNSKMRAKVTQVCAKKGCWMKLDMGNGEEAMVRFKDYGFFMPKDITGKEVIVNGKAFIGEMSVKDQRHYAEDAGKSKDEIEAIVSPKKTYSFLSDGVLLVK